MSRGFPTKALLALCAALSATALAAAPASAQLSFERFEVELTDENGAPQTQAQAGSHPFAVTTTLEVSSSEKEGALVPDAAIKDLTLAFPPGFIADATAVPPCSTLDFLTRECADSTVVGANAVAVLTPTSWFLAPVENLEPPPGVPVRLGFEVEGVFVTLDASLETEPPHAARAELRNIPNAVNFFGSVTDIWGVPADEEHDRQRGGCLIKGLIPGVTQEVTIEEFEFPDNEAKACDAGTSEDPLLTLPRSCEGQLEVSFEARSWQPGPPVSGSAPLAAMDGCDKLRDFSASELSSLPTTDDAESASGLHFGLGFDTSQLTSPTGTADSDMEEIAVALPEGMTVNPSIAEGLGVCSLDDIDDERLGSDPGDGCPSSSKLGTVEVDTPLVDQPISGQVYLAEQDNPDTAAPENPFDSLIALYIVLRNRDLGVFIVQAGEVEPDPRTGQLLSTFKDIPQVPFAHLSFRFREGQRAPLITPPTCGDYETEAQIVPRANPSAPASESTEFEISDGVGGGPCPPGGTPPFAPGFLAGSLNNAAGAYSPFVMRLLRADGHQDITRFSATLPPGVLGRLAGVDRCPEAQIALARSKSGRAEHSSPSCPANSQIGSTLAGAGVGQALTHVPGALYLAGPYGGAPLSAAAITPALAGPFDAGTVVVRVGLDVDPRSGVVSTVGGASDPIPHILKGIVLKVRDLRVHADRPSFTLNPTSCDPSATWASVFGSFLDVFDPADDVPVALPARYQAAGCQRLGFKPRLALRLKGGTRRGAFPALRAVYRPRAGDANLSRLALRFPRSAFIEQGHFRTICTRAQFAAGPGHGALCPKGSVYGRARAFTPLLDEPLEGPVFLRSSDNELPDAVFALSGLVDFEVVVRIDSVRGGLRATVTSAPDAPVSRVVVNMRGGKKGLFVNSRNLCLKPNRNRANARLTAHNARRQTLRPVVRARCGKKRARGSHRAR